MCDPSLEKTVFIYYSFSNNNYRASGLEHFSNFFKHFEFYLKKISEKLAGRIKELAKRYENPLPILTKDIQTLSAKVDDHLKKMGFKW